ncbi:hypothetical protein ABT120_44240 [Nonomuraea angiospora]
MRVSVFAEPHRVGDAGRPGQGTSRIRLGTPVSSATFRQPGLLRLSP